MRWDFSGMTASVFYGLVLAAGKILSSTNYIFSFFEDSLDCFSAMSQSLNSPPPTSSTNTTAENPSSDNSKPGDEAAESPAKLV